MHYGAENGGVATKSVVVPRSFESALFSRSKSFLPFLITNPPMKVPQKMAATLPDGNDVNEATLLKHPTTKSSSRKSKFKVYRKQNSDKRYRINVNIA